jgi:hypothetical protein
MKTLKFWYYALMFLFFGGLFDLSLKLQQWEVAQRLFVTSHYYMLKTEELI